MGLLDDIDRLRNEKDKRHQEALALAFKNADQFPDQASFENFIKNYQSKGIPDLLVPGAGSKPPAAGPGPGNWMEDVPPVSVGTPPTAPRPDLAGKMAASDAMINFMSGGPAPAAPAAPVMTPEMEKANAMVSFATGEPAAPEAAPVAAGPAASLPAAPAPVASFPAAQPAARIRFGDQQPIPSYLDMKTGEVVPFKIPESVGNRPLKIEGPSDVMGGAATKNYTPEQMAALESGDTAKMAAAWPNGVPADAFTHATTWQTNREARAAREEQAKEARAAREAEAQTRRDAQKEKQTGDRVTKFSKAVDDLGIPEAMVVFNNIKKYVPQEGDIPGFGRAGGTVSQWFTSQEGLAARQAVSALKNIKIKDRSGAAVTPQEFERLDQEIGAGKFKTEAELRRGIQQALETYKARLKNAYGGVSPEVRAQFYENQGVDDYLKTFEGLDFSGKAAAAPTVSSQAEYEALPAGAEYVSNGQTYRKK